MAKLGRYSADRKKVESLTANKTVEVSDCGTLFILNASGGGTVTLPNASDAGNGWWCKFILGTKNAGGAWEINATSDDGDNMYNIVLDEAGGNEDSHSATAGDQVAFAANTGEIGCQVELVTDCTNWYGLSASNATGAVTSD